MKISKKYLLRLPIFKDCVNLKDIEKAPDDDGVVLLLADNFDAKIKKNSLFTAIEIKGNVEILDDFSGLNSAPSKTLASYNKDIDVNDADENCVEIDGDDLEL